MAEVFIHVGPHKTGSTAIQEAMFANLGAFAEHDLLVPRAGRGDRTSPHHNLAWDLGKPEAFRPAAGGWQDLLVELDGARRAFITAESLSTYPGQYEAAVATLMAAGHRVITLFVWRHQLEVINSSYSQRIKTFRIDLSFDVFWSRALQEGRYRYHRKYAPFLRAGDESRVLTFDPRTLVQRVFAEMGLPPEAATPPEHWATANVAPLAHEVEALRRTGATLEAAGHGFKRVLDVLSAMRADYPWSARFQGPSAEQRAEAIERFAEANDAFFRMAGLPGPVPEPAGGERSVFDPSQLTPDEAALFDRYQADLLERVRRP